MTVERDSPQYDTALLQGGTVRSTLGRYCRAGQAAVCYGVTVEPDRPQYVRALL